MRKAVWIWMLCMQCASAAPGNVTQDNADDVAAPAPFDYDYAWDQFKHRGTLLWACRGVQSGAIVSSALCEFKARVDTQWPDKNVPKDWRGVEP